MKPRSLPAAAATFVLACAVMIVFDSPLPRIVGVVLLFAALALAVFAIATDDFVAGDEREE